MKKIKLFCFPYAGGSATVYNKWKKYLHPSIQLIPVELPGRGRRINEPLLTNIEEVVNDIYHKIQDEIVDTSYAFFGHSMGGLLAFETINKLRSENHQIPEIVFFSGKKPPHIKGNKARHLMSDEDFIEEILSMGGTPKEILEQVELLKIFIPILRADFKVVETYEMQEEQTALNSSIVAMYGTRDSLTSEKEMEEWSKYTKAEFQIYHFDGDHFFIHDHLESIVDLINQRLIYRK